MTVYACRCGGTLELASDFSAWTCDRRCGFRSPLPDAVTLQLRAEYTPEFLTTDELREAFAMRTRALDAVERAP